MKISPAIPILSIALLLLSSYTDTKANAVALSRSGDLSSPALSVRDILGSGSLEKRRGGGASGGGGGGGGGGRGGGGSSGGRSSSSSSSGSRGSSSSGYVPSNSPLS